MPADTDPAREPDPARDPLEIVADVRRRATAVDGHDPLDEAADLHLRHRAAADLALWTDPAGGFALVRDGQLDLAVHPEARGDGIGTRLAARALAGATDPPSAAWSHGDHPAAARIAAQHDWRRTRDLWVMRRPTSRPLPDPADPAGVTIRGLPPGTGPDDPDARAVLRINAAAFADHPEQGGLDRHGLAERMAEDWWDPAGLLVAVDDATGAVLGFHWTKQHDADTGEVYVVGIGPDAQGRGLGRALTLAGLRHLDGLGVAEVLLYVESDNAPAVHVYSGLGFTHADADTHVQFTAPARWHETATPGLESDT